MSDRPTLIPASYIFLEKNGKYVFGRRLNTGYYDGFYQIPAGHVEEGESASEAMIREAREEVGVEIDPQDLEFVHVIYRMNQEKTGFRVDFFFKTSKWRGEVRNCEPNKCDDLQWFAPNELPENVVPLMRIVLKNMEKSIYLTETAV